MIVEVNGKERFLGLRPTPVETYLRLHSEGRLVMSHQHPRIMAARRTPRSEWIESTAAHFWKYRKDQNGQGACVGFSASHALDITYAKKGFDIRTCPACIYAQINGGVDNGANVGDCIEALSKFGTCLDGFDGYGDLDWKRIYRTRFWREDPPGSRLALEAAKHVVIESIACSSADDFLAALQDGEWAGQFCLGAGDSFDPDADGFLPRYDGTPVNHALCATGGMKKHPKTGKWCVEGANSWDGWGLNGLFYCDEEWLDVRGQEMVLFRTATLPSNP